MEKTIQMLKAMGVWKDFTSTPDDPKFIDFILFCLCEDDEELEDTFLQEAHILGIEEICRQAAIDARCNR